VAGKPDRSLGAIFVPVGATMGAILDVMVAVMPGPFERFRR
jgi:hypothetical protein